MESPYFSKIYDLGQDVDKLYKDIMKNDIITNIRKYSKILYDFIREKYFTMVPFGKNLTNIIPQATLCFWKGLLCYCVLHWHIFSLYDHFFCNSLSVAYPEILFGGGVQQIQLRTEDRENGDLGGGSPLVRGSGDSCNLVQEISFHMVKFS